MKKNSIYLLLGILLIVVGAIFFTKFPAKRLPESNSPKPQETPLTNKIDFLFYDNESGFFLEKPSSLWENIKVETNNLNKGKLISLFYPDSEKNKVFLISFLLLRKPVETSEYLNQPNLFFLGETKNFLLLYSQSLEIPYQKGSKDFNNYTTLIKETSSLLEKAGFRKELYLKVVRKVEEDQKAKNKYSITLIYPQIKSWQSSSKLRSSIKAINNDILKTINNLKAQFANRLKSASQSKELTNFVSTLKAELTPGIFNENHLSFSLSVNEFAKGMAHPWNYSISKNYSIKQGKEVSLSSLFKNQPNYLITLSNLAQEKVKAWLKNQKLDLAHNFFVQGLSPNIENFKNFLLTSKGIEFHFAPGQVAPAYLGEVKITISYQELGIKI